MDIRSKAHIDTIYFLSFAAVLVLLPWYTMLSTYAMIVMVLFGVMSTSWKTKINQFKQNKQVLIFTIFYFLYVIGLIYTSNVNEGLNTLDQKLALFIIPLLVVTSASLTACRQKSVLVAFAYSNALLTLVCVILNVLFFVNGPPPQVNFDFHTLGRYHELHADAHPLWMQFSYISFSYFFMAPTYFSIYLIFCILILAYHPTTTSTQTNLKYIVIAWLGVVIILLSSRMGIILLIAVSSLNVLYFLFQKKFPLRETALAAVCIVIVGVLVLISPVTRFRVIEEPLATPLAIPSDYKQWNSMNLRVMEWQSGMKGIKENGIKGTGTGGALDELSSRYDQHHLGELAGRYNAHNQYIETYLEIGLPGFIALSLCFLFPLVYAIKKRNKLLLSLVVLVAIGCLTTSMFEKSRGLMFYLMFISLFMFAKDDKGFEE